MHLFGIATISKAFLLTILSAIAHFARTLSIKIANIIRARLSLLRYKGNYKKERLGFGHYGIVGLILD